MKQIAGLVGIAICGSVCLSVDLESTGSQEHLCDLKAEIVVWIQPGSAL